MAVHAAADKLGREIENIVLNRIETGRLSVPPLPEVATRCTAAIDDPDFSLRKSVELIEQDPVVAGRVLQRANSAANGGGPPAGTILEAVTRLGLDELKNTLVETAARELFESKDPRIAEATRGLWHHSVAVGIIARDLVALGENAGAADATYLAGLLHDIGKPVVAAMMLEAERVIGQETGGQLVAADGWVSIIERTHRKVGVALAEKWALPAEVAAAIADNSEYDTTERGAASNYVRFANAVAKQEGICVGSFDEDDVEALIMIGRSMLGVDDDILAQLTDNLHARVQDQAA